MNVMIIDDEINSIHVTRQRLKECSIQDNSSWRIHETLLKAFKAIKGKKA